jgi:hypothetical protein
MGYHVSIVRTSGRRVIPIQLEEAKAALLVGNEWRFDEGQSAFAALGLPEGEEFIFLQDGELWTKTPSEPMLCHMISAAQALNARVRGDELETYESVDKSYVHPDDKEEFEKTQSEVAELIARRKRRNYWLWIFRAILLVFLAVGVVRWWLRQ